jgi:hypothetical protein
MWAPQGRWFLGARKKPYLLTRAARPWQKKWRQKTIHAAKFSCFARKGQLMLTSVSQVLTTRSAEQLEKGESDLWCWLELFLANKFSVKSSQQILRAREADQSAYLIRCSWARALFLFARVIAYTASWAYRDNQNSLSSSTTLVNKHANHSMDINYLGDGPLHWEIVTISEYYTLRYFLHV